MTLVNQITSINHTAINHIPGGEGRFRFLTFLNRENGGPGTTGVTAAIVVGMFLYTLPHHLARLFPAREDQYPLAAQRVSIGVSARNYLQQNPGLQRLIHLATDSVPITSALFILFNRQLALQDPLNVITVFPAACVLVHAARTVLYSIVLLGQEHGSPRVSDIANRIGNFIRPNLMRLPEPLWTPEFTQGAFIGAVSAISLFCILR